MEYIVIFDGLICRSITSIVGSDSSELEQLRVKIFFFLSIINITHTLTALEDCKVDYNCEYGSFSWYFQLEYFPKEASEFGYSVLK